MADDVKPPVPTVASVNQRVPPGPAVITDCKPWNPLRLAGRGISTMFVGLLGSSIPSLLLGMSSNQSTGLPPGSGPTVIACGLASGSKPRENGSGGIGLPGVILAIAWKPSKLLDSATQRLPSGPAAIPTGR